MALLTGMQSVDGSRDTNALPRKPPESSTIVPSTIGVELNTIKSSLNSLSLRLETEETIVTHELENRIRQVYDSVLNDMNEIRNCVNGLGDLFSRENKYRSWTPTSSFRKDLIQSIYEIKEPLTTKHSQSVSSFGSTASSRVTSRYTRAASSQSRLDASDSSLFRKSVNSVEGFGSSFRGSTSSVESSENVSEIYQPGNRCRGNLRHSWGPSRSGSRSTLDDFDETDEDELNSSCDDVIDNNLRLDSTSSVLNEWNVSGFDEVDGERLTEMTQQQKYQYFRERLLHVHNVYRKRQGSTDLVTSEELTNDAQQWAESLAEKGYAQYSEVVGRGENVLLLEPNEELSADKVGETWYREGCNYSFSAAKWQRGTSHFTQLVWRSTVSMGIGVARLRSGRPRYIIVVQYHPQGNGNLPGEFKRNVLPVLNISDVTSL